MTENLLDSLPAAGDTALPLATLDTCDRCGPHIRAIWLITAGRSKLTFCGSCYRKFRSR